MVKICNVTLSFTLQRVAGYLELHFTHGVLADVTIVQWSRMLGFLWLDWVSTWVDDFV